MNELLDTLQELLKGEWGIINDTFIIDEIEDFSKKIKELGSEYRADILTRCGDKLLKETLSFNLVNARKTLAEFPALVERIKAFIESKAIGK